MQKLIKLAVLSLSIGIVNLSYAENQDSNQINLDAIKSRFEIIEQRLDAIEEQLKNVKTQNIVEIPLDQPSISNNDLALWAKDSVTQIYNYSFIDYKDVLVKIKEYFTSDGYDAYISALKQSGNLDLIRDKNLVVSAKFLQDPEVMREGLFDGVYSWELEFPLVITYQGDTEKLKQDVQVTLLVQRVSKSKNPKGIGIFSIEVAQAEQEQSNP